MNKWLVVRDQILSSFGGGRVSNSSFEGRFCLRNRPKWFVLDIFNGSEQQKQCPWYLDISASRAQQKNNLKSYGFAIRCVKPVPMAQ